MTSFVVWMYAILNFMTHFQSFDKQIMKFENLKRTTTTTRSVIFNIC